MAVALYENLKLRTAPPTPAKAMRYQRPIASPLNEVRQHVVSCLDKGSTVVQKQFAPGLWLSVSVSPFGQFYNQRHGGAIEVMQWVLTAIIIHPCENGGGVRLFKKFIIG
jgi:hypothetical protein